MEIFRQGYIVVGIQFFCYNTKENLTIIFLKLVFLKYNEVLVEFIDDFYFMGSICFLKSSYKFSVCLENVHFFRYVKSVFIHYVLQNCLTFKSYFWDKLGY